MKRAAGYLTVAGEWKRKRIGVKKIYSGGQEHGNAQNTSHCRRRDIVGSPATTRRETTKNVQHQDLNSPPEGAACLEGEAEEKGDRWPGGE